MPTMGAVLCRQAVMYFRRALKLDRNYLSAWTLMGHEYVEMKNIPAAIGGHTVTNSFTIFKQFHPVQIADLHSSVLLLHRV